MRLVLLVAVMLLTLGCISATAIPSGRLFGRFEKITLASPCTELLAMSLRTDLQNKKPVFTLRAGWSYGQCTWSIASVRGDQVVTLAPIAEEPDGGFTPSADGAFWFISQGRYVKVSPNGQEALSRPRNVGFTPAALASTGDGHLFSIESQGPRNEAHSLRVVNLDRGTSTQIPLVGEVDDPMRSFAGQLLFRLYSGWPDNPRCTILQITNSGSVIKRADCQWENANFMAVDPKGAIWQPTMLGVSNGTRFIGPIVPAPCSITNTAALEPHLVTAYRDGSVWFAYDNQIWRGDVHGNVTKTRFPAEVTGATSMVQTADGSIWFFGRTGSSMGDYNQGNLYRFIPTTP